MSVLDEVAARHAEREMSAKREVIIDYTNWRGKRGPRRIVPKYIHFGTNKYHRGEQWFLYAFDLKKNAYRHFALKDIHMWEPGKK